MYFDHYRYKANLPGFIYIFTILNSFTANLSIVWDFFQIQYFTSFSKAKNNIIMFAVCVRSWRIQHGAVVFNWERIYGLTPIDSILMDLLPRLPAFSTSRQVRLFRETDTDTRDPDALP